MKSMKNNESLSTILNIARKKLSGKVASPNYNNKAGVLLYSLVEGVYYVLCVKQRETGYIGFPKGGQDDPEEPLYQTALREFQEEVGADIKDLVGEETPTIKSSRLCVYLVEIPKEALEEFAKNTPKDEEILEITVLTLEDLEKASISNTTRKILGLFRAKLQT